MSGESVKPSPGAVAPTSPRAQLSNRKTVETGTFPAFAKPQLSELRYMIQVSGNRVRAARFPSFAKEGWLRHKKMPPFLSWRRRGSCFKPPIITTDRVR